jgi:hypothetical protein
MTDSIRLQCLEAIQDVLEAMVVGEPLADPYTIAFDKVKLGPLGDVDYRQQYVAGIVTGRERLHDVMNPAQYKILPVAIEFRMYVNADDGDPAVEAERLLAEMQRKLAEDTTLGGLAIDFKQTSSEVLLGMYDDRTVLGDIFFDLHYRHGFADPRVTVV